ncbi:MAG: DUF3703 domain-containing protein [Rheinheimera sp.]|nr:DUF3703 domain-containing protein [Rheinheimera sp.]
MSPVLRNAFLLELAHARRLLATGDQTQAFLHLERAHILSQAHVAPHVQTHWLMLKLAWLQSDYRALAGQAIRIVLGALGSALGRYPVGNTGGSNINMFRHLPVPSDLQAVLEQDRSVCVKNR